MADRHLESAQSGAPEGNPSSAALSKPFWIVVALTAVAAVVRLWGISGDLYADEIWIVHSAKSPYDAFLKEVMGDWVHPPLFFFLMHGLDAIVGIDDLSGRTVAAISGVISVPIFFWIGRMVHSQAAGLVGATILALSPIHVWHSQYGRHYSLMVLLVLLSTATFLKVWRSPKSLLWSSLYILSTVALVYTHYFGWIVVFCQSATFLIFRFIRLRHWFSIQLVILIAYVPWLIAIVPAASAGGREQKLIPQIGWMEATTFWYPIRTIIEFNGPFPVTAGKVVSLFFLTAIGALALRPLLKKQANWKFITFLFISVIVSFVLVFGISCTIQPMWLHRVMMISLPAYYLIIGIGTQVFSGKLNANVLPASVVSWVVLVFVVYSFNPHRMPYEDIASFLERTEKVDSIILIESYYLANPLRKYYDKPAKIYELYDHHVSIAPESQVASTLESLKEALKNSKTVIVVNRFPLRKPMQSYLDANYANIGKKIFVGKGEDWLYQQRVVSVYVYEKVAEAGAGIAGTRGARAVIRPEGRD